LFFNDDEDAMRPPEYVKPLAPVLAAVGFSDL